MPRYSYISETPKSKNGYFEIYKDSGGRWRFRLKAANNEIVAVSESYNSHQACLNGISAVKRAAKTKIVKELE